MINTQTWRNLVVCFVFIQQRFKKDFTSVCLEFLWCWEKKYHVLAPCMKCCVLKKPAVTSSVRALTCLLAIDNINTLLMFTLLIYPIQNQLQRPSQREHYLLHVRLPVEDLFLRLSGMKPCFLLLNLVFLKISGNFSKWQIILFKAKQYFLQFSHQSALWRHKMDDLLSLDCLWLISGKFEIL